MKEVKNHIQNEYIRNAFILQNWKDMGKKLMEEILTKAGKLQKRFLPAVYFDSSVLIDYWMTEGMEMHETEIEKSIKNNKPSYWRELPGGDEVMEIERGTLMENNEFPHWQVVRGILRSEDRINKVAEIRKKLVFDRVKVTPVISSICLLELIEWQAEAAFKQIASEASGTIFIQKRSKKDIGDYLKKALELRKDEIKEEKEKGRKSSESTGLELLMIETWLNSSFAEAHGLEGLLQVDIANFNLTIDKAWAEPSVYGYLQLGAADIMHILFAQHLGCKYIASFDSDFKRVKNIITEETGMTVLTSAEEILAIL